MDIAGTALLLAHLHRLVHHAAAPAVRHPESDAVLVRGEQVLRRHLELHIVLDTLHHYDIHLPGHLPGSQSAGEAADDAARQRHADAPTIHAALR